MYDVEQRSDESVEMRKIVIETANSILMKYIGTAGYQKNTDFYYNSLLRILENSNERELVLERIFTFIFENIQKYPEILNSEYRCNRMIDIANMSIEKMR